MTAPSRPYDRLLRPISLADALATPAADALFIEPTASGHPRLIISTTIEADGHQLSLTFYDTPVDQVLAILRRQHQPARPGRGTPAQPRRAPGRSRRPRYEAVWSDFDFDDAPDADPRGAAVVATATQLLELGKASCWSNALDLARHAISTQETRQ